MKSYLKVLLLLIITIQVVKLDEISHLRQMTAPAPTTTASATTSTSTPATTTATTTSTKPATAAPEPTTTTPMMTTVYTAKGKVSNLGDLPIYTVGTLGKNKNTIIYIYDIYGFEGGRTRQMCDDFAAKGYYVVLPDFYRGDYTQKPGSSFSMATYTWDKVKADLQKVYDNLKTMGVEQWVMIGACWGGWVVFESSKESKAVIGGISYHPSLSGRASLPLDQMASAVQAPQLVIATKQEPAELKEKGIMETTIKAKFPLTVFKTYETMTHGFVPRGDLNDAAIKASVEETMKLSFDFLSKVSPVAPMASTPTTNGSFINICLVIFLGFLFLF